MFSLRELEQLTAPVLARLDEPARSAWEAYRVDPVRWQCSGCGDAGAGFWVVALVGNRAAWFNHLELGFNLSSFTQRGVLDEYRNSSDGFEALIKRLPPPGPRVIRAFSASRWFGPGD